jgi:hypothetical protein
MNIGTEFYHLPTMQLAQLLAELGLNTSQDPGDWIKNDAVVEWIKSNAIVKSAASRSLNAASQFSPM